MERVRKFMLKLGKKALSPKKIAEVISGALTAANPKLRYQITPDPLQQFMVDRLPKRFADRIIAKRLGLTRRGERVLN
jgi:hypothetical protein